MNIHNDQLSELFPLECEVVNTTGIGDGIILKFKTFYLKIYNDDCNNSYIVTGYRYNGQKPIFTDTVPENQMRQYASQFISEYDLRCRTCINS